jgi:hypothetical protein
MTAVQSTTRRRILRLFVRRALRAADAAKDRSAWQHDGDFSLDAGVRSEGHDRPGMERLLRYCARPPFARERIERSEQERILYHLPKPTPEGQIRLRRSPLELIGCLAALTPAAPPPRLWRARTQRQAAPGRDRDGLRGQGDRRGWHPCQRRGRQRDRQSLTGTVSLGDAAGPTLRGVSAALPRVRGTAADHRVHHRIRRRCARSWTTSASLPHRHRSPRRWAILLRLGTSPNHPWFGRSLLHRSSPSRRGQRGDDPGGFDLGIPPGRSSARLRPPPKRFLVTGVSCVRRP